MLGEPRTLRLARRGAGPAALVRHRPRAHELVPAQGAAGAARLPADATRAGGLAHRRVGRVDLWLRLGLGLGLGLTLGFGFGLG